MKTLLVLAEHPGLAEAIRAAVNPETYRVLHRSTIEDAQPVLGAGLMDLTILDVEAADARGNWLLESVLRRKGTAPVLVFTDTRQWQWEEDAYLRGAAYVLTKPVHARLLNALLERLLTLPAKPEPPVSHAASVPSTPVVPSSDTTQITAQSFHCLRDFSAILTHSLETEPMLREFLLMLREILGVNRAAIFLRPHLPTLEPAGSEGSRSLRSACAIGISGGSLEEFQLSMDAGIAGFVARHGRILRRNSPEALAEPQVQQEFERLGAQFAIPMLDREKLVGVAVLDGRVTGEAITSAELAWVFQLLEELGLAVRNIWLHEQVSANHEIMANILRQLSSACVVVSRDLAIAHANKMARHFFAPPTRRNELEFGDLPATLGTKIYQVLQTGSGIVPFRFTPPEKPGTIYQVTIVPFQKGVSALPNSALMMVEDLTQTEQLKKLELEANNLRMVRTMSESLAHEINNAITPLDAHGQLIDKHIKDFPAGVNPGFWNSLAKALNDGVKRISRRGAQMRTIAQDTLVKTEVFEIGKVVPGGVRRGSQKSPCWSQQADPANNKPPHYRLRRPQGPRPRPLRDIPQCAAGKC